MECETDFKIRFDPDWQIKAIVYIDVYSMREFI